MNPRARARAAVMVSMIGYTALDFVALLVVATWCTWHHGYSDEGVELRVVMTWFWLGLITNFAIAAGGALVLPVIDKHVPEVKA